MQSDSTYPPELLEAFRLGLINQIIDRQYVIAWADKLIEQEEEPAYLLIELSLCGRHHLNDMIALLDKYVGENKPQVAGRAILGHLYHEYDAKRLALQRVVGTFYWLSLHSTLSEAEQELTHRLDVNLELAADGVCGTVAEVEQQVLHFLTVYRDFNLSNWQQWSDSNYLIPASLQVLYQQAANW